MQFRGNCALAVAVRIWWPGTLTVHVTARVLGMFRIVNATSTTPGLKTVGHVCVLGSEKAAWFEDPEGNILCLHEELG